MTLLLLISRSSTATVRTVSTSGLTATATGLLPGNKYDARVRARDAAGNWSAWSSAISFTTVSAAAPATVAGNTIVPSPAVTATGPTPATVVGAASVAAPVTGVVRTTTSAGTTASVSGLSANVQYRARVRARDAAGNWSDWSPYITFTTLNVAAPATVQASTIIPTTAVGGAPPVLVAGLARPVLNTGTVLLDVTATPPGASSITGYLWSITAGLGSLTNSTTATPTYTAPGSGTGTATVRVTVTTSNGGTAFVDTTVGYGASITAAENQLAGTARSTWDLADPNLGGVSTLQGFCDGFTADRATTFNFKIAQSDTAGWSADIYRLGWYGGTGARLYGTITPTAGQVTASQAQPSPGDADPDTSLLSADCAGWSTTLTWTPPAWTPSGMFLLRLNRTGGGASHIMFVVRDDARTADLMLMPADATWNAYNAWGGMGSGQYTGNSLYYGTLVDQYNADCAHYVSYNRPVVNRGAVDTGRNYGAVEWSNFFTAEFPMVRFLERNGVDVKYYGCIDAAGDSQGTHLLGNGSTRGGVKAAMFTGHNEYWSDVMRAGWERAKNRGVSVFSCAGNEVFWRLVGTAADSEGRPRTWECQKSTINGRGATRPEWTGTWRDPDGAGKGGNNPELSFTGTIYTVNGPDLRSFTVPFAGGYSATPLWRNTSVASLTTGQTFTSPDQLLGFEWDTYGSAGSTASGNAFMGSPHPRAVFCSNVTYTVSNQVLTDAGDVYGTGNVTHRLVVHPGGAGAMAFATGTVNWALGCDAGNYPYIGQDNVSTPIQQATLNILTDMGAPPRNLMAGLTQPSPVDWFPDVPTSTVVGTVSIPAPITGAGIVAAPAVVAGAASVVAPTMRTGSTAQPAVVAAAATVPAAVPSLPTQTVPATVAGVTAVAAPAVQAGAAPAPAVVSGNTTVPAPAVSGGISTTVTASTVGGTVAIGTAGLRTGATATPGVVTGSTTVGATTITFGQTAAPGTVAGATGVGTPALGGGTQVSPATATGAASIPAPTVVAASSAGVNANTVQASAAVGTPATTGGANAQPTVVGGAATVPGPIVRGAVSVNAATVGGSTTIGGFAQTGIAPQPAMVAGTASIPTPTVQVTSGTAVTPATLAAQAAVAAVAVLTGSQIAPATVAGSTTVGTSTVGLAVVATPIAVTGQTAVAGPGLRAGATAQPGGIALATTIGTVRQAVGQVVTSTGTAAVKAISLTGQVVGLTLTASIT